jgi:hypothetical protein
MRALFGTSQQIEFSTRSARQGWVGVLSGVASSLQRLGLLPFGAYVHLAAKSTRKCSMPVPRFDFGGTASTAGTDCGLNLGP